MPYWLAGQIGSNRSSGASDKPGLFYGWVVVAASLASATIIFGARHSFGVFFKSLQEEFGWTRAATSGIFSLYMLICAGVAIFGGWALDRYGPRALIAIGGFFTGLSLLLASRADTLWHLYATYSFLLALGTGAGYTILRSTVSRWFVRRRGLALGLIGAGVGLGMIVMAPLASFLISAYGWRTSYVVMAAISCVVMITAALFLKKEPGELGLLPDGEAIATVRAANGQPSRTAAGAEGFSLLEACRTKNFWVLFLMWFFYSFCLHMILTHAVPHATDLGISPMQAATAISLLGTISILGRLTIGPVSDRVGKKQAAVGCALVQALTLLWLMQITDIAMLYAFAALYGFSYGGLDPPTAALVGDVFGLRHVGVIMGVVSIGWGVGAAAGPALAGRIFDITGSYSSAFLTGAIGMLLASGLALLLQVPKGHDGARSR